MNTYENSSIPRLFELLEKRGVSAKQLSDATGIATSTITSWKSGARKPKYDAVCAIADFFNVPAEYLTETETTENTLDLELRAEMQQLSDDQKKELLKYAKYLQID